MLIALPINESDTTSWFMAIKNRINTLILQPPKKKKKKFTILPRSNSPFRNQKPHCHCQCQSLSFSLSGKSSQLRPLISKTSQRRPFVFCFFACTSKTFFSKYICLLFSQFSLFLFYKNEKKRGIRITVFFVFFVGF